MEVNNPSTNIQIQPFGRPNQPAKGTSDLQTKSEQPSQQERVDRLDVDENAITLLEQEQQASGNSTTYDQPSKQNMTAVSAYQAVDNIEKRDSVKQLLGVDIFA